MIIVVDFDETLFPTFQKVISIYNKRNNTSLTLEQMTEYNLYECLQSNIADELIELFCCQEVYNNIQPFSGAAKAIKSMMNNGQNGGNSDIISAIKNLGSKIGNMSGNVYNVNGITYDDGSNVAEAIGDLVRAARIERRV